VDPLRKIGRDWSGLDRGAKLDAYLLAHEKALRAHGAPLSPAFKKRARSRAGQPD